MRILEPQEICTQTYFLVGNFKNKDTANNLFKYLQTRFVRFLILMTLSGYSLSQANMSLVPNQDFETNKDIDWSQSVNEIDHQLYRKYDLSHTKIEFIESLIKEMC